MGTLAHMTPVVLTAAAAGLCACGATAQHGVRAYDHAAADRAAWRALPAAAPTHRIALDVVPGAYRFAQPAARAAAGRVSITLRNGSGVWHDVEVVRAGSHGPAAWPYLGFRPVLPASGADRYATDTTVVDLRPGHYRLICNILGHAGNGMNIPFDVVADPRAHDAPAASTAQSAAATLPANRVVLTRRTSAPRWDRTSVTARAGRIGFELVNDSPVPTNLIVLDAGAIQVPDAPATTRGRGGFTLNLQAGDYQVTNLADGADMTIPLHVR